jgi:hypothetical protein
MTERKVNYIDVGKMSRRQAEKLLARLRGQEVVPCYKDPEILTNIGFAITFGVFMLVAMYALVQTVW